MKISAFRNRLAIDTSARDGIVEQLNGGGPFFWNGGCSQFEVALFRRETLVDDLSNIAQITLEVKPLSNIQAAALMSSTVLGGDINEGLSLENWEAGDEDDCHAKFEFTGSECNLDLGAGNQFWLVLAAKRPDGEAITLGAAVLIVAEDGSSITPTSSGSGNVRFNAGYLELRFSDGSWHYLKPATDAEAHYTLDVNQSASGETADLVSTFWRYDAGLPQIQFADNSWHAFLPTILEGQYMLDIDQSAAGSADGVATKFRVNLGFPEIKFGDASWHRLKPILDAEGKFTVDIEQTATP